MSKNIEALDNLDVGEVAYVIELLAAMCTPEEIKDKFFEFTDPGKPITHKTIQKIAMRYAKRIAERNDMYLKNIDGNPLSHRRIRLDILNRIVKESMVARPSHSVRVGEDYEMVMKADLGNAIKALKLAMDEMNKLDDIRSMEKQSGLNTGADDDDDDDYEADNGIARLVPKA